MINFSSPWNSRSHSREIMNGNSIPVVISPLHRKVLAIAFSPDGQHILSLGKSPRPVSCEFVRFSTRARRKDQTGYSRFGTHSTGRVRPKWPTRALKFQLSAGLKAPEIALRWGLSARTARLGSGGSHVATYQGDLNIRPSRASTLTYPRQRILVSPSVRRPR